MDKAYWESCYSKPLSEIPWEISKLPLEISRWLEEGLIRPGMKVLDVGCGAGGYAIELAKCGAIVTGIDISDEAIKIARQRAESEGVKVSFIASDAVSFRSPYKFDFAFDYSIFHHIELEHRARYVSAVANALAANGVFGVVCYSNEDDDAHGATSRVGEFGNIIYHPTKEEISASFDSSFEELSYTSARLGKKLHHKAHCYLFRKRKDRVSG